jgi:hypothetical protein
MKDATVVPEEPPLLQKGMMLPVCDATIFG